MCFLSYTFLSFGIVFLVHHGEASSSDSFHSQPQQRNEVDNDFPYSNIRLPRDFYVDTYILQLHPNLTTFNYTARVGIVIYCKRSTDQIILHSMENSITKITLSEGDVPDLEGLEKNPDPNDIVPFKSMKTSGKLELLLLEFQRPITKGKWYTLLISFSSKLGEDLTGFYKSSYETKSGETRYIATTQFQPTYARFAFPCFDEPDMKAKFDISITRDPKHVALSNMPIKQTVTLKNGLKRDNFQPSLRMSTYLVAFVVCDFKHKEATSKDGVQVRVWTQEDQLNQADIAIDAAPKILDHFNSFFGVPFPLPKQDLIAIPDFASGAMENWGLIMYHDTTLLYDPQKSSTEHKQRIVTVIAHELAHQWFGNLVTMKWWNDLWLNEGFASYVEFLGVSYYKPSWKMMDQFSVLKIRESLTSDAYTTSHAISVKVENPMQIDDLFDRISYDKGASVIRMLQNFVGSNAFHKGLKGYLEQYKFQNAETDDLWDKLAQSSKLKVKNVMDTWTLQMGFPLVTIARDPKNPDQAIAEQKHFLNDYKLNATTPSPFNYKWEIPLTYFTKAEKSTTLKWLHKDGAPVSFAWPQSDGWIKANVDNCGYYRCNYDENNWKALINQLNENHKVFSALDRANLMDDAFAIAKAEQLSQITALDLTSYLAKETDYVPIDTALTALGKIGTLLEESSGHQYYQAYIVKILKPLIHKIRWQDTGSHLRKKLREKVFLAAVENDDMESITKMKDKFQNWMKDGVDIPVNLIDPVYLAGIKHGLEENWDFMWQKQEDSRVAIEKEQLMLALAQSQDKAILQRYLEYCIDETKVKFPYGAYIIGYIGKNKAGRQLAWKFIKSNWSVLLKRYGNMSSLLGFVVNMIVGGFTTQEKLEEATQFFDSHEQRSAARAVKQSLEQIKGSVDWLAKHEQEVVEWLRNKTSS